MLLPRFLTALIGMPLLLSALWWGQLPFLLLVLSIVIFSLYEYCALLEDSGWPIVKPVVIFCGGLFSLAIIFFGTSLRWAQGIPRIDLILPALISVFLVLFMISSLFSRKKENGFLGAGVSWFGLFYVVWALSHLFLIREIRPDGKYFIFFLFFVVWSLDIGAYFSGMKFGKNKLSPMVSPKKTWEGVAGGSLTALLTAALCGAGFLRMVPISKTLCLTILIVAVAQISDLSESLLKRNLQVKDSGSLLPGHGGFLDRFDSFLLTAPLYYYALVFFVVPR